MENAETVWNIIHRSIEECINAKGVPQNPKKCFNQWDSFIQKFWTGIKIKWANDGDLNRIVKVDRKEIRWRKPKKGWVKINFDGASKGNRAISGVGAVA